MPGKWRIEPKRFMDLVKKMQAIGMVKKDSGQKEVKQASHSGDL